MNEMNQLSLKIWTCLDMSALDRSKLLQSVAGDLFVQQFEQAIEAAQAVDAQGPTSELLLFIGRIEHQRLVQEQRHTRRRTRPKWGRFANTVH